jgi:5'-nucleotidase
VDCVKLGLLSVLTEQPDWVVSGINRGANATVDTLYSGTVAGAMEAHIMGRAGIAVSLVTTHGQAVTDGHWALAADWAARVLAGEGRGDADPLSCCFNVNVPAVEAAAIRGVKVTTLGRCHYTDGYRVGQDPSGRAYYWLHGEMVIDDDRDWTDVRAVRDNWVSVTPLTHDLTAAPVLAALRAGKGGV